MVKPSILPNYDLVLAMTQGSKTQSLSFAKEEAIKVALNLLNVCKESVDMNKSVGELCREYRIDSQGLQ